MWSGAIGSVPSGWSLCNGANGTPDLRNRFIVGAGSTYAVGLTGGADTVTLTVTQMPEHNHTGSTSSNGAHTHTVTTNAGTSQQNEGGDAGGGRQGLITSTTSSNGAHTHTISNQGGNEAHENRPPYYALAYIMKL